MKKLLKGAVCIGLAATMLGAIGCNRNSSLNPEVRPLQLSIGALDGNFNPFFYSAQYDGDIAGNTQMGMFAIDKDGGIVCGDDWPTAVLAYKDTKYDAAGNVSAEGDEKGRTEYEFIIKNGVKFSDGHDLSIKDVLFNLYVYLDPMYTGSSTIYSTDIQGLKAYRTQNPNLSDDADDTLSQRFTDAANNRILDLIDWSQDGYATEADLSNEQKADLAKVKSLFREEATSDWTSIETSWKESYEKSYRFTETWEAYLFNEGLVEVQTKRDSATGTIKQLFEDKNGNGEKDDGELYYTTLDLWQEGAIGYEANKSGAEHYREEVLGSASNATEEQKKQRSIDLVYNEYTSKQNIAQVLSYWATGNEALTDFASDEMSTYYDKIKDDNAGLLVKSISGIKAQTNVAVADIRSAGGWKCGSTTPYTDFSDGTYDKLTITINGVDPKALFNFSFVVAPMHYYSDAKHTAEANCSDKFGVEMGDKSFFDSVLAAPEKTKLPVGAGVYKAFNGNVDDFYKNNIVRFERNTYFETTGKNITNAKIKYLSYKVLADDKILEALETGAIDYGKPNSKQSTINELNGYKNLSTESYDSSGYGYVGVNPKFVPDVKVRQAIMHAMDASITTSYYGSGNASRIYRPMSKTSWAYPTNAGEWADTAYLEDNETNNNIIKGLVESAGYRMVDGVYVKDGKKLKLTFTIAGESADHPAYSMFTKARDRLNKLGFEITVQPDIQALKKLTSGNLAVWAAAWTAAVDPDMYQVYHMDSKATSVNNWNYKNILADSANWVYEYNLIKHLSECIEQARSRDDRGYRASKYSECLDDVMRLAVELPTYQRKDLYVYNNQILDKATLVTGVQGSSYLDPLSKIWLVNYVK